MSDDITNLMQQMYDYFLHLYAQQNNTASENTFLSFESIGTPITDDMFKLNPSDTTYSRPLAVEQFSKLVNTISPIDGDAFQHTDRQVDDFYNILLAGAQLADSSADNTLFTTIKAEAVRRFEPTVGSLLDETPVPFHPSYPTPDNWYDMSNESNWTTYTFSSSSSQGTTPPVIIHPPITHPPVTHPPVTHPWNWRVLPETAQPILKRPELLEELVAAPERAAIFNPVPLGENKPILPTETTTVNVSSLSIPTVSPASQLQQEVSQAHFANSIVSEPINHMQVGVERLALADADNENVPVKAPPFRINQSALVAARFAPQIIQNSIPQRITSNSIQVTFKYCLVNVNRPWLSAAFLALQGWDVAGYPAGAFSTGSATNNTGFFPALPVAMLAVKDVQITANWTSEDLEILQHSAAFGPFSLIGRTIDSTTTSLSCQGTLIIGWVCQIMALLPPVSSPNS